MYAVRPMLMTGCSEGGACGLLGTEGPLHLAGYGVELAIKNMEYSALDDSQVSISFTPFPSPPPPQDASGTHLPHPPPIPPPCQPLETPFCECANGLIDCSAVAWVCHNRYSSDKHGA